MEPVTPFSDVDARFTLWTRNVQDEYKGLPDEEIKSILKAKAKPFAVCFENWIGDFNMSTGIRNANGFGAKEAFYCGKKKWDRRGAVGTHNYTDVAHLSSAEELAKLSERYTLVGVDNVPGSVPMETFEWPNNTLMVFGEEGCGLTPEALAICKHVVHIQMFGSVRSFNCGTASGIAMYDFVSKHSKANV